MMLNGDVYIMELTIVNAPLDGYDENRIITADCENGFSVSLMTFGATLCAICVPDHSGNSANIICCFDNLSDFVTAGGSLNANVGPVAGRIADAAFVLNGTTYRTDPNENGSTLHSGNCNVAKRMWTLLPPEHDDCTATIRLTCSLADGEGGFPGNRTFTAAFRIAAQGTLSVTYTTETDAETPANLTNHAYFDLSARFDGSAHHQLLQIAADRLLVNDERNLPVSLIAAADTPYDFRAPISPAAAIARPGAEAALMRQRGIDNAYALSETTPQITLYDPISRRRLQISTDQRAVVFYMGGFMEEMPPLTGGNPPVAGSGICLETQDFPNAYALGFPIQTAKPDCPRIQQTTYHFDLF